jgi:demethylmenaquinone methyltransferase/2-methoxy-6-polyprenyl-1,4-benzoquinol methylase
MMIKMGDVCAVGPRAVKAYFDSQAEHWDRHTRHDPHKLRYIMRVLDLHAGQRVLDVACGTGVLFPWLLHRNPELLMGIDISEAMTERARAKCQDRRLRVVTADYYHLAAGAFDRIILYDAYPHFFDKEKLAQKTFNLLADGGRFIVAHDKGRETINAVHDARGAGECSVPLRSIDIECCWFEPYFSIDNRTDNEGLYVFSGVKRG